MNRSTDAVLDALKQSGYRMTPQRRAIVEEIMAAKGHIAPQAISERVKDRIPGVNDSTVYRTIELLEEMGFLAHAHLGAGAEYHHVGEHGHVHLVCERCGRDDELSVEEAEPLRGLIEKHSGFLPDFSHFAVSGLCADCREAAIKPRRREAGTKHGSR